ncbi:MAG: hypothetical protein MjAS7_2481 [Metallosphaera javensis (ex Sakai et al. 2022)]|nr:MAG: hypothetical protein MjAS7_2481 [Metallosphaera javensis (ex Sakai et al. 2022)]
MCGKFNLFSATIMGNHYILGDIARLVVYFTLKAP